MRNEDQWYHLENADEIASPALLVYHDRLEANLARMIEIAGAPDRLRPHVKTHKMPAIVALQLARGIRKFKCATIAEAQMTLDSGGEDVMLDCQPVGPNMARFIRLIQSYPGRRVSAVVDCEAVIREMERECKNAGVRAALYVDIDNGLHRTGIAPGAAAFDLYARIARSRVLQAAGFHVYDGHIHDCDPAVRERRVEQSFAPVERLAQRLRRNGLPVPAIVAGGSPTFPFHAKRPGVELSPGTTALWDEGYQTGLPDLPFQCAALVLTRVVSKPGRNLLCFDLGTKALASEMPHPRARLIGVDAPKVRIHNEERLVVACRNAAEWSVGDCCYAVPVHICPTTALYQEVSVAHNRRATEQWRVLARDRRLAI